MNILKNRLNRLATTSLLAGLFFVAILGLVNPVRPALAVDCTAGSGAYPTIQSAINDLGCTVIIIPAGTFAENLSITRDLTLQGAGTSTIINGSGSGRPVTINGNIIVYINNARITNGNATSASPNSRFGGGVLVAGGATLHGVALQVDNNVASTAAQTGFGGGLAVLNGSAYLTDTVVLTNTASTGGSGSTGGTGGGLYAAGLLGSGRAILHMVNGEVRDNIANNSPTGGNIGIGGGLRLGDSDNGQVVLVNTRWEGNAARGNSAGPGNNALGGVGDGGAIAINPTTTNAQASITNNEFINNIANASDNIPDGGNNARGGAILADNGSGNGSIVVTMTGNTMTGNIAKAGSGTGDGQGGAIYGRKSAFIIQGGVISGNVAARNGADRAQGGGIRLSSVGPLASVSATGVTIVNNVALQGNSGAAPGNDSQGGGIQVGGSGAVLTLTNSIVADNAAATLGGNGAQVYIDGEAKASIVHATIANATLNPGQGIYAGPTGNPNDILITNTIVVSHQTGVHNQGFNGRVVENYMLFYGNTNNTIGSVVGNTGNVSGYPAFVNPAGRDYHIGQNSQAIDNGTNAGVTVDIDNQTRPAGAGFDIGADEYVAAPPPPPSSYIYLPLVIK